MLNYPVMYSLSERERAAVNMQGTVYLSKIENSFYHQGFVDVFFMIVRCDAVENYMFFKDSQLV